MKLKKWIALALGAAVIATGIPAGTVAQVQGAESEAWERTELNFNTDWLYSHVDYANGEAVNLDESGFESVSVPHANKII